MPSTMWILLIQGFLFSLEQCYCDDELNGASTDAYNYSFYDYLVIFPSPFETECMELVATDDVQYFTSHDDYDGVSTHYETNTDLCWTISAMDDTKSIDLISETIDLAEDEKFPSCTDMLSIFDGTQTDIADPIVNAKCVKNTTWPVLTSFRNSAFVLFIAGNSTNPGFGFKFGYKQVDRPICKKLQPRRVTQTFMSHAGPGNYPSFAFHCWTITFIAPMVELRTVNNEFELEYGPFCAYDRLAIRQGNISFPSVYCGKSSDTQHYLDTIRFTQPLELIFRSDFAKEFSGFNIAYRTRNCHRLTATSGQIKSHDEYGVATYRSQWYDCWIINGIGPIELKFRSFELEADDECGFDFVKVYDGGTKEHPLLGIFCGSELPETLRSRRGSMLIEFQTDAFITEKGFKLHYRSSALNLPIQEDSKAQQYQESSRPNFSIQRQKRGQAPRRTPGDDNNKTVDRF